MALQVNSQLKRYIFSIPEVKTQGLAGFLTNQNSIRPNIINNNINVIDVIDDKINDKIALFIPKLDYLSLQLAIKQLNEDYGFFKDNVQFYTYTTISLDSITRLYTEFKHNIIIIYKPELPANDIIMLEEFFSKNSVTCFYSTLPIITNSIINYSSSNADIKNSYITLLSNINDILPSDSDNLQNKGYNYVNAMIILEENSVNAVLENTLLQQKYNIEIDVIVRVNSTNDTFTNDIINYLSNPDTINTHMCIINITDPSYLFRNINTIINNNPILQNRLFIVNATFIRTKPTFDINGIITLFTNVSNFYKYSSYLNYYNEVSVNKLLKIGSIVQEIEPLIVKMNKKKMGKDLLSELKKMGYVINDNGWYNDSILYLKYTNNLANNITYEKDGIMFSIN